MNAILLWIIFPLAASVLLWFLRQRAGAVATAALVISLTLAMLAWLVPIDTTVRIGSLALRVQSTLVVSGRQLILSNSDRPLLIFFYALSAFWFGGAQQALGRRLLAPYGLSMVALLVSAQAVEPQLYAALAVEIAVLLSIPMLITPGERIGQGVLRYLIFQTLAMPFILMAGWALEAVEANPSNTVWISLSIAFLGLGFAFWLAVFPFYTWAPLLASQARPYVAAFLFIMLPTTVLMLVVDTLNTYGWLRSTPQVYLVLRLVGALMVVTAGVWAAFQQDVGRLMGHAALMETGFSLLALSLNNRLGSEIFAMLFFPRIVALALWALSASVLVNNGYALSFSSLERVAERFPFASAGLATALLTLGGLPLLATFAPRLVLLQEVAALSPLTAVWVLAGSIGLLFSGFRLLAAITGGYFGPRAPGENRTQVMLIGAGCAVLLLVGLVPRVFLPLLPQLMGTFTHLP